MMEMDRIKWDEGMMTRCLSRLTDAYPQPAEAKEQVPAKAAESEFILEFDIPAEKPVADAKPAESEFVLEFDIPAEKSVAYDKPAQRTGKWDDFKKAIDMAF